MRETLRSKLESALGRIDDISRDRDQRILKLRMNLVSERNRTDEERKRANTLLAGLRERDARLIRLSKPLQLLLWCPSCGKRHVDEGEWSTREHSTHACQHCGMTWRPSHRPSFGVRFLPDHADAQGGQIVADVDKLADITPAPAYLHGQENVLRPHSGELTFPLNWVPPMPTPDSLQKCDVCGEKATDAGRSLIEFQENGAKCGVVGRTLHYGCEQHPASARCVEETALSRKLAEARAAQL